MLVGSIYERRIQIAKKLGDHVVNDTKIVYTLRMRLALHKEGIEPAFEFPNPKNPKFISWVYERTPEFNEAFNRIYNAEKESKKNGKE